MKPRWEFITILLFFMLVGLIAMLPYIMKGTGTW